MDGRGECGAMLLATSKTLIDSAVNTGIETQD